MSEEQKSKKVKEPYVPRPKTKEELRKENLDFVGMIFSTIIMFAIFIWLALQI